MTSDAIVNRILSMAMNRGCQTTPALIDFLSIAVKETSDFERLLLQPKTGSSTLGGIFRPGTVADIVAETDQAAEKVRMLNRSWTTYARATLASAVAVELFFLVSDLIGDVWHYYQPTQLDPQKYNRGGCAEGLENLNGGIWRQDHAQGVFDLLDQYENEVKREFSVLRGTFAAGVLRELWVELEGEYFQAVFSFGAKIRQAFTVSRFGEQHPKRTRNGVRPR